MAEQLRFTDSKIKALPLSADGSRLEFTDDHPSGTKALHLRVSRTKKTWYVIKWTGGKTRREKLGEWPQVNVQEARKRALELLTVLGTAEDPKTEREVQKRRGLTLRTALYDYITRKSLKLKPGTIVDYEKAIAGKNSGLAAWLDDPIADISRQMVTSWYNTRCRKSKSRATVEARYLRAVLNSAEAMNPGTLPFGNPVTPALKGIWQVPKPRSGRIAPTDMPAFLTALEGLERDTPGIENMEVARAYIKFLLFSGVRSIEARRLKVVDIDLRKRQFYVLTKTTGDDPQALPLNDALLPIVEERISAGSDWLFPNLLGTGSINRPSRPLLKLNQEVWGDNERDYVTLHDLRRTFRSVAGRVCTHRQAADLVCHKLPDVDSQYDQPTPEELLEASNRVAKQLLEQAGRG